VAEAAFSQWLTLEMAENYTETDIDEFALGIGKVAYHYRKAAAA